MAGGAAGAGDGGGDAREMSERSELCRQIHDTYWIYSLGWIFSLFWRVFGLSASLHTTQYVLR
jgi:hypothetical protein